ncbi:MAG: 50S ribosomal protein L15 [Planctomycetes bacterium]|nr:50S ribosomal protein L15 [Planctomycetota bacterium]
MNIHDVHQGIHAHRKKKRVGRGVGSGHGKTSGRGHKGQSSHAGWKAHPTFQGGAMPLVRRVPKRGFHNAFADRVVAINVCHLEQAFESGAEVTPDSLLAHRVVKGAFDAIKILGNGELTKKLKVSAHRFSASAKEKIEKAGGEAVVLAGPTPVAVKQKAAKAARAARGEGRKAST